MFAGSLFRSVGAAVEVYLSDIWEGHKVGYYNNRTESGRNKSMN